MVCKLSMHHFCDKWEGMTMTKIPTFNAAEVRLPGKLKPFQVKVAVDGAFPPAIYSHPDAIMHG
jgi:hypothetical protein